MRIPALTDGGGVDEGEDALVGVDENVAEGREDSVEVGREGKGRSEKVRVGCFGGGKGGVGQVEVVEVWGREGGE